MTGGILPPITAEMDVVSGRGRLAHDGWVSEFEAFQGSESRHHGRDDTFDARPTSARYDTIPEGRAAPRGLPCGKGGSGETSKTMDTLRSEIKLLHWHKLANEAALKAALLKTKKIKAQGGATTRPLPAMTTLAMPTDERATWMHQIIEEEQSKPLQVTKHFISEYEEREKQNDGKIDTAVAAHISSLRNLRRQIEKSAEAKARRKRYRTAQKQLDVQKQQLLLGKLQSRGSDRPASSVQPRDEDIAQVGTHPHTTHTGRTTAGALDTVLGSLDKLVELEKRISSLEQSNVYDDSRSAQDAGNASADDSKPQYYERRQASTIAKGVTAPRCGMRCRADRRGRSRRLSFAKQKTEATAEIPSQVYYSVRVRGRVGRAADRGMPPGTARPAGIAGATASTCRRSVDTVSSRTRAGVSTFLTQLPDVHRNTRTEGRQQGRAVFRSATMEKRRLDAKRRIATDKAKALRIARQDRIIREWLQSKRANAAAASRREKPSGPCRSQLQPSAASRSQRRSVQGTVSTSGKDRIAHLQDFREIRAHYAKRTDKLKRDLARGTCTEAGRGPFLAGTRTLAPARPRAGVRSNASCLRSSTLPRTRFAWERKREERGSCTRWDSRRASSAVDGTAKRVLRTRPRDGSKFDGTNGIGRYARPRLHQPIGVLPRMGGNGRRAFGGLSTRTRRR